MSASAAKCQVGFFLFPLDLFERADRVCRLVLPPEALGGGAVAAPLSSDATAGSFSCDLAEAVSAGVVGKPWLDSNGFHTDRVAGARLPEPAAAA